jgi:thiamine biosynthesis protein ThiI
MLLQVFSAILSGLFFASSTIGKIINMESIAAVSQPQAQDIILDVRHPDEAEQRPLIWPANQIICLPFFQIKKQLDKLDREQSYLLYCEKGIMSRLHADAMQKNGFEKVAVFVL